MARSQGNGRATFRDLVEKYRDRHFKRLYVFGTNLTQQAVQKFSYQTTPDVAVADAVRISMSIPFFFEARYYEQNGSNDAYCDGGVLNNYPITPPFNSIFWVRPLTLTGQSGRGTRLKK
jgi:NTE family protein